MAAIRRLCVLKVVVPGLVANSARTTLCGAFVCRAGWVRRMNSSRLQSVGILETPKQQGKYETGQLFLHKVFGYRGIVLFPWVARLYDRDVASKTEERNLEEGLYTTAGKEVKGKTHTYYQVLIDSRDCPYIRAQTEGVTFLGNTENSRSLYAIPVLSAKTCFPFFMQEAHNANVYWWRYCIRLENLGEETVQLRERHWRIFSLSGTLETVRGRGVIGREPVLSKEQPAFQYSSHVSLQAPSGHMWGTFRMERSDGHMFDCRIPPFSLESKSDDNNSPHGFVGPKRK
ncbi:polymerase delta-interacting protein 2-like [Branchiostoma floridae]|uniref:Polymerase delta-interacting protein 2-like n=1 Tax=Branchiostoma floridae TaxID=7739 RepID=A0A9J7LYH1_BRAFL|nr:polymerase delta-interacting protein 2-like [Branchiostoma floridae]